MKSAKRRKNEHEETKEQVEASEPSNKLKKEEYVCDDSTCKLYIATFIRELFIHKNKKLIEMSEDYGQWIYVLISFRNAGATFELAQAFSKLKNMTSLNLNIRLKLLLIKNFR